MARKGAFHDTAIGNLVREKRLEQDLSQLDLALELGYTHGNFIGMVETGIAKFPREKVIPFADALGVPREKFIRLWLEQYQPDWLDLIEFKK